MKLAGISGKGRGRLGSMVFSASAGEQIVRQYQPNVSNPNTAAQVNQRAKFKLMAQVAAAVSGEIIIPRNGLQSPRNLFQKKNFGLLTTDGDTATLQYEGLQFTAGNVAIPAVAATRAAGGINVALSAAANVSRVVYLAYRKSAQGALQFASSTIVDAAGDNNTFPATLAAIDGEAVIYAYGMRDLSASATAKYGDYSVTDGTALATLVLSRTLSSSDYQFTRTSGTTLPTTMPPTLLTVSIVGLTQSDTIDQGPQIVNPGDNITIERTSIKYGFTFKFNALPANAESAKLKVGQRVMTVGSTTSIMDSNSLYILADDDPMISGLATASTIGVQIDSVDYTINVNQG